MPAEAVFPFLSDVELVLSMGVIPGHGGQAFIPDTLDKIKKRKAECKRLRISPYLSVDGDVKFTTTAPQCIEAGVTGEFLAMDIVDTWIQTEFSHLEKHQR